MDIITGYTGTPHITSAQDRAENQGTFGTGSYILNVGLKMAAEIISATEVRIKDGVLSHQGCLGIIESGMYDALTIENGSQGMKRRDLIVCRYEKNAETNVESLSLVVIRGTATSGTPTDPSYNTGSIQGGDSPVDFPLYRVNINGVSISSITQVAENIKTQMETDTLIGNTAMGTTATTITGAIKEHETDISTLNDNTSANLVTNIQTFSENMPSGSFRVIRMDADSYTGTDLDELNQYYKSGTGFIIKRNTNSIRVVVFNGGAGAQPAIMRLKNSAGWQPWQKFDGTNV